MSATARPALRIVLVPLGRTGAHGHALQRTIWVDPRQPWPAHTLLHEMIHVENPSWSETAVRRETTRRWRRMTWQQKAALLRMFGRAVIGTPEEGA